MAPHENGERNYIVGTFMVPSLEIQAQQFSFFFLQSTLHRNQIDAELLKEEHKSIMRQKITNLI